VTRTRQVTSHGVALAVVEHTEPGPGRPTVVLVHGYPDEQRMWEPVVAALAPYDLHVVTYDVRGAGRSGVPARTSDYRTELLVDDLAAVLDATLPEGARAHLVGHDWGSVQLWEAVTAEPSHPRLRGRIASFTSISGPSLRHTGRLVRRSRGRRLALLRQLRHSWYVGAFHVPAVPDLVWRRFHRRLGRALAAREGLGAGHWGAGLGHDAANGLNLYRANVGRELPRHHGPLASVPVLVVRPLRDRFLTGVLDEDLEHVCSDVRRAEIDAGHWVARTHPAVVADLVAGQVRHAEERPGPPA
jgi:pimeloyl-ACP methyl ester carboxylesterase